MRKLLLCTLITILMSGLSDKLQAQAGVLDPNDPDVVFTNLSGTATPPYGRISKWGHTARLNWNGKTPFQYGYKSYYYKAMAFRLKFPKTYQHNVNDGKKYPLFIFLHGLGERGDVTDNEYQMLHGGLTHAQHVDDGTFDGFVLYTQSSNGFHNSYFPQISELIDSFAKYVKVDVDRVILSGLSSGGQSDWEFMGASSTYVKKIAALIPISAARGEYKSTFPGFITVPVWMTNGGLDVNPAPETVTDIINTWKGLGGSIKQTFFPFMGHGVWDAFWSQPDYFPSLKTYHKANPLVYFGKYQFCPGESVNINLGLQAGFYTYEWQKDGVTISGATSNTLNVNSFGTYRARFKRTSTSAWSDWSPSPIVVGLKATTITPPIQINGLHSNVLPAPDGSTAVPLTVPGNFVSYEWRRVSDNTVVSSAQIFNAGPGQYTLKVMEEFGCSSTTSAPFTVINANGNGKPDKPTNGIAVSGSTSSIKLDWNDNPNPLNNETGFEIYRSDVSGGPYTLIQINPADNRTYTDQNLSANKKYYYILRSVNNNGASDATNEISTTTQSFAQVLPTPSNFRVTGTNSNSVSLAWTAVSAGVGTKKYDIYINGVRSYTTTNTSFTVQNLDLNTVYTFKIKAKDDAGNSSAFSNQVSAATVATGVSLKFYLGSWTSLPDFNTLSPFATLSQSSPTLSGTGIPSTLDGFGCLWEGYIYIPTTGSYTFRTNSDDGSKLWLSTYTFSAIPLVNNDGEHTAQDRDGTITLTAGAYPISIGYFNRTGPNTFSVSWKVPGSSTFVAIPSSQYHGVPVVISPLTNPSNLAASPLSTSSINLTWTDNSNNETGFEIWRSTTSGSGYLPAGTAAANATSFVDSSGLSPNTRYYYQIKAINSAGGESNLVPAAGTVSAVTNALPPAPNVPSVLTANPISTTQMGLLWNDNSSNETSFEVWRSVGNNTTYRLLAILNSNPGAQDSYNDTELFANTTYYYKVRANGTGGYSNFSNETSASTGNNPPVLTNIGNFTMRYGSVTTLNISASDPDVENVTISALNVPSFGVFSSTGNGTGQIVFSPSAAQQGSYNISAVATDSHGAQSTVNFVLTVNSNYVPVANSVSDVSVNENTQTVVNLSATDQDGNASLVWSAVNLPSFVSLTSGSNGAATLNLHPNYAQAGVYSASVKVSDGAGGEATVSFTITVNNIEIVSRKWYVNMLYNQLPGGNTPPWNNINTASATDLHDATNQVTPVDLQIVSPFNAFNGGPVTGNDSGVYPDNVLRDYFYFGIFGAPETVDVRLTSLDPASTYNITLYAGSSWGGVADNGTTVFTINGVSKSLYVQNNTQNTITFQALHPNASGQITITLSKAAGTPVGYLNAMVIEQGFDDGTAPVLPQNLAAQALSDGTVKLTWTDIAYNEQSYVVYRSTSLNGVYTPLNPGAANNNTTQYIDNTANGLTTYYYKLEAVNTNGSSGLTNAVNVTTVNKAPAISAINDVYVKSGNSTSVHIIATDDASDVLTTTITNLPAFASFIDNGNGNGTININPSISDIGIYKNITVTTTDNHGATTVKTFNISVADNQTRTFYVNFAGETGTAEGKPWNNIISYPFAGVAFNNLKDDVDATSNYSITSLDTWTSSWYGGMITGNNGGIYPDNVIKSSIYDGTTNVKRVQFAGLNPAKLYNIAVFSSNNGGFDASFTLSCQGQTMVVDPRYNSIKTAQLNGLIPDPTGTIQFTMTKSASANYMFLNAVVLQEYDNGQLIRPIELITEINTPGKINLSWSDRSNIETGYEVWRATAGGSYSLLATLGANVGKYTDNSALPNIRYFYKVRALNGGTPSEFSNVANKMLGSNLVLVNLSTSSISQSSPWNNARTVPLTDYNLGNLINTAGRNTGYALKILSDFGGNFDQGMNVSNGVVPANVMRSSWWVEGGGPTAQVSLYNLNQGKIYRVGIMGSSSWTGDFTATYTINGRVVYLNAYQNTTKMVYIDDVKPNDNGEIIVTLGSVTGARWGFWSAVTLESYDDDGNTTPISSSRVIRNTYTAESKTKLSDENLQNQVKVLPNPFDESLTVKISTATSKNVSIRLLDISGRVIVNKYLGKVEGVKSVTLSSHDLGKTSTGAYVLQIISDGKIENSIKLLKTK